MLLVKFLVLFGIIGLIVYVVRKIRNRNITYIAYITSKPNEITVMYTDGKSKKYTDYQDLTRNGTQHEKYIYDLTYEVQTELENNNIEIISMKETNV